VKKKDLSMVCGNTVEGKEAFQKVICLALRTRIKLGSIAQKAIGVEFSEREGLKEEQSLVISEFNSLRFEILREVSETAVEVGNQISIDDLCNSAA